MKLKILVLLFIFTGISFCDELHSLTNKGISAFKKENFAAALEYFSTATEKYPASNEARFNKGLALGATGNAKEAEAILSSVKFEKDKKNAEVFYSRARIIEAAGDAALEGEQPNIGEAKKAYQTALSLYAQALDLQKDKNARKRTINNIEILSQKIKNLPEEQQQNQDNEQNQNENKDENKDEQQDKNEEQNQNEDDQQDQNKEQNEDENNENEQNQDENQQSNEQNEENQENQEQNEQQQSEQDEKIEDAVRLLEHYADDAKELNKPPVQKAVPAPDGKDW